MRQNLEPKLQAFVSEVVADGRATAAVGVVGDPGSTDVVVTAGSVRSGSGRRVLPTSRFDLASLTKPWMATLALTLEQAELLPLRLTLGEVWGSGVHPLLSDIPLESLLRHRSGLAAWTPLYRRFRVAGKVPGYLLSGKLLADRRQRYSDLGYILWGLSAERAVGESLSELLERFVARPLGAHGLGFAPGAAPGVVETHLGNEVEISLAAEQGISVSRGKGPALGAPQDGNALFLGVAGHAGLFGSALHLHRLGSEWLRPRRLLTPSSVERALAGGGAYALGWRRRTVRGSAGLALSRSAFGHVGFTGGSLWLDPDTDKILILLAHRSSVAVDLAASRRNFHQLALESRSNRASNGRDNTQ